MGASRLNSYYEYVAATSGISLDEAKKQTLAEALKIANHADKPLAITSNFSSKFVNNNDDLGAAKIITTDGSILFLVQGFKSDDDLKNELLQPFILKKSNDPNAYLIDDNKEQVVGKWQHDQLDVLYEQAFNTPTKFDHHEKGGYALRMAIKHYKNPQEPEFDKDGNYIEKKDDKVI